jgi:hypothetical protein
VQQLLDNVGVPEDGGPAECRVRYLFVAEVLVGLATDTAAYLSRREDALKVNTLTFIISASDSSWRPRPPGLQQLLDNGGVPDDSGPAERCVRYLCPWRHTPV